MELEFEAVKRVKLGGLQRWTALVDGDGAFSGESKTRRNNWAGTKANVKGAQRKEVMWTPVVGLMVHVSKAASACTLLCPPFL